MGRNGHSIDGIEKSKGPGFHSFYFFAALLYIVLAKTRRFRHSQAGEIKIVPRRSLLRAANTHNTHLALTSLSLHKTFTIAYTTTTIPAAPDPLPSPIGRSGAAALFS